MNHKITIFLLSIVLFTACGSTRNDAVLVNDRLVSIMDDVTNAEKTFFDTCLTYDAQSIQKQLKQLLEVSKKVKGEMESLKVHEDLTKLKLSGISFVDKYIAMHPDYTEYARLYSIPTENYTEEDEKKTTILADKINNEIDSELNNVLLTQQEFADKYGYIIEKKLNTNNITKHK